MLYKTLYQIGREYDVAVKIAFQGRLGRYHRVVEGVSWNPDDLDMPFDHLFSRGFLGLGARFHSRRSLNPDIIGAAIREGFDFVLFPPSMSAMNWVLSLLPLRKSVKILYSEANRQSLPVESRRFRASRRLLYSRFNAIACPGERALDLVRHIAPNLVDAPVLWLPNIVDQSVFVNRESSDPSAKARIRRELGLDPNALILLGIGPHKGKGKQHMLKAAARISTHFQFIILGGGAGRDALTKQSRELGIAQRVLLPGLLPERDVVRYYRAADWFIHPSLCDCSPLACVEAAFSGLPLALSEQTGNAPELVQEGANGFTFDPTDDAQAVACLERILSTPAQQARAMGAASARLAKERFDVDIVAQRFFDKLVTLRPQDCKS